MSESLSQQNDSVRKRVGKACDRCRLKKSKCNGDSPCSRCIADNAICVFGERKRAHDKVYPKGYVEMLEQQQAQLVAGLQETHRRMADAGVWPGAALDNRDAGHPLTHDILIALDIIRPSANAGDDPDVFEDDTDRLQSRLLARGAPLMHRRRGSVSSESDCGSVFGSGPTAATTATAGQRAHKRARSLVEEPSSTSSPAVAAPSPRRSFDLERPRHVRGPSAIHHCLLASSLAARRSAIAASARSERGSGAKDDEDVHMSSSSWPELTESTSASSTSTEDSQVSSPDPSGNAQPQQQQQQPSQATPQYTFPTGNTPFTLLDGWPDIATPGTLMSIFGPPMQGQQQQQAPTSQQQKAQTPSSAALNQAALEFTNLQQLQKGDFDVDLGGMLPMVIS